MNYHTIAHYQSNSTRLANADGGFLHTASHVCIFSMTVAFVCWVTNNCRQQDVNSKEIFPTIGSGPKTASDYYNNSCKLILYKQLSKTTCSKNTQQISLLPAPLWD